jgi:hypothetical protein
MHLDSVVIESHKLTKLASPNMFSMPDILTDTLVPIHIFISEWEYVITLYKQDLLYCHVANNISLSELNGKSGRKKMEYFYFSNCTPAQTTGPIMYSTKMRKSFPHASYKVYMKTKKA